MTSIGGAFRLLVPNARVRIGLLLVALLVGAAVGAVLAVLGADKVIQIVLAIAAAIAAPLAAVGLVGQHVSRLLGRAGEAARTVDVRDTSLDAEVEVARAAEIELRQELADLSSGRRVARLAAERSAAGDYRAQLGLVSRIHDDFVRMSEILQQQSLRTVPEGVDAEPGELPRIDRIVLYIDDLDRCPPQRVIEVLEAVHLILAVPLFVVVVAVDPRWLLQSLRLHYSELLAQSVGADMHADEGESAWHSTPVNYLEKIIQVPFALRPIGESSVSSLVRGLLPVEASDRARGEGEPTGSTETGVGADAPSTPSEPPDAARHAASLGVTSPSFPSLSPRTLALTQGECDFAVTVAGGLWTPRTVKKFTNLYRLLRAGLDEYSGELDRFLADNSGDAPQFRAVLILLATIIAFPEEASEFLVGLGDIAPGGTPQTRSWTEYLNRDNPQPWSPVLRHFLDAVTETPDDARPWTCERSGAGHLRSLATRSPPAKRSSRVSAGHAEPQLQRGEEVTHAFPDDDVARSRHSCALRYPQRVKEALLTVESDRPAFRAADVFGTNRTSGSDRIGAAADDRVRVIRRARMLTSAFGRGASAAQCAGVVFICLGIGRAVPAASAVQPLPPFPR